MCTLTNQIGYKTVSVCYSLAYSSECPVSGFALCQGMQQPLLLSLVCTCLG